MAPNSNGFVFPELNPGITIRQYKKKMRTFGDRCRGKHHEADIKPRRTIGGTVVPCLTGNARAGIRAAACDYGVSYLPPLSMAQNRPPHGPVNHTGSSESAGQVLGWGAGV